MISWESFLLANEKLFMQSKQLDTYYQNLTPRYSKDENTNMTWLIPLTTNRHTCCCDCRMATACWGCNCGWNPCTCCWVCCTTFLVLSFTSSDNPARLLPKQGNELDTERGKGEKEYYSLWGSKREITKIIGIYAYVYREIERSKLPKAIIFTVFCKIEGYKWYDYCAIHMDENLLERSIKKEKSTKQLNGLHLS